MKLRKKYLLAPVVCSASMLFFGGNIAMAMDGHQPPELPLIVATQPSALRERNSSVSFEELESIRDIENDRHIPAELPRLRLILQSNMRDFSLSPNFRMYCLSIAVKIMQDEELQDLISFSQSTDLNSSLFNFTPQSGSGYACLFYRCIDKCISSDGEVRSFAERIVNQGIDFLKRDGLSTEKFKNYDGISKLYILKSICAITSNNITTKNNSAALLEKIGKIEYSDLVVHRRYKEINRKILLTYAKIPVRDDGVRREQIGALEAIFGDISGQHDFSVARAANEEELKSNFDSIARTKEGLDALLAYAKIPGEHQKTSGLKALEAIFGNMLGETDFSVARSADEGKLRSKFDTIATKEGGIDALLAYANIPVRGEEENRLRALYAIFGDILGQRGIRVASADERGLVRGFSTIAGTKEGRDALLAYAKIPGDMNKQLEALGAIFGDILRQPDFSVASAAEGEMMEKFGRIAGTKEGRDALLAYANIPVPIDRVREYQRRALDAIFKELGGHFTVVAGTKEGRDALLAYAKIPGEHQKTLGLMALNAIFQKLGGGNFDTIARYKEGRDALLAYAKILVPSDRVREDQRRALYAIFGSILRQPDFRVKETIEKYPEFLSDIFSDIAGTKEGLDALLAYARIPVEGSQESRIAALEAVHFRDPRRNAAVKKLAGNIYTSVRAKSNYENKSSHLERLDALMIPAQRPAQGMRAPAPGVRRPAHEIRESESETQEPARGTHRDLRK